MENEFIKVLLIEDDNVVAQLIEEMFNKHSKDIFNVHWEDDLRKGINYLKNSDNDIILLDLFLPDSKGFDTLSAVHKEAPYTPIVILTGLDDAALAVKSLQHGAQDYLIKSEVTPGLLIRAIQYAIERGRIEEALAKSRDELEERVKKRTIELFEANEHLKSEIEERKRQQRQLQEAYAKLKEAQSQLIQAAKMQVVGTLASGVAHEVKNPLAIILQGVEFLEKRIDTKDANVNAAAAGIKEAVERADRIIKGLLDFSSVSKLNIQKEDINSLIDKCVFLLKHEFNKRHISVIKDLKRIPPVPIDKNKIEQVFINIFMNAAYAMDKTGGELTISSRVAGFDDPAAGAVLEEKKFPVKSENALLVEVADTGGGIPEGIIGKIFEPFFTTNRSQGGAGLGLAIVKNIIDMHKGMIYISNVDKEGVRVRIYFRVH